MFFEDGDTRGSKIHPIRWRDHIEAEEIEIEIEAGIHRLKERSDIA
jgi:hypothetical protein